MGPVGGNGLYSSVVNGSNPDLWLNSLNILLQSNPGMWERVHGPQQFRAIQACWKEFMGRSNSEQSRHVGKEFMGHSKTSKFSHGTIQTKLPTNEQK